MQQPSQIFHSEPRVVFREDMDNGAILYHPGTDKAYHLNPTAARIWSLIGAGVSRVELEQRLRVALSDPAPETLASDLDDFLTMLIKHDLAHLTSGR